MNVAQHTLNSQYYRSCSGDFSISVEHQYLGSCNETQKGWESDRLRIEFKIFLYGLFLILKVILKLASSMNNKLAKSFFKLLEEHQSPLIYLFNILGPRMKKEAVI